MAIFEISVHSELREEAQPLVDALQYVADFIEGLYGYKMCCQDTMNTNEYAELRTAISTCCSIADTKSSMPGPC